VRKRCSLAHADPLSFGHPLRILCHGHAGFATDDKEHAFLMDSPQILSIQIAAIHHDGLNVRMRSQILLRLLQERDQPLSLILLNFDQFHRQRQARLHLNEHQDFPPIDVIFLGRRFWLSFDFHGCRVCLSLPQPS
jgi:hypothetical protein